jgi:hypothetical protein
VLAVICLLGVGSPAGAATRLPGVRTPSRNIGCLLVPGRSPSLLCSLTRAGYSARLQSQCMTPGGAGVDWHGFTLSSTGKGLLNCSGGSLVNLATQRPSYSTLAYGHVRRLGPFACSSSRAGLTCRNGRGHGLFISRESWRAW